MDSLLLVHIKTLFIHLEIASLARVHTMIEEQPGLYGLLMLESIR